MYTVGLLEEATKVSQQCGETSDNLEVLSADINHSTKHTSLNDVTGPLVVENEQPNSLMSTMSMLAHTDSTINHLIMGS